MTLFDVSQDFSPQIFDKIHKFSMLIWWFKKIVYI